MITDFLSECRVAKKLSIIIYAFGEGEKELGVEAARTQTKIPKMWRDHLPQIRRPRMSFILGTVMRTRRASAPGEGFEVTAPERSDKCERPWRSL